MAKTARIATIKSLATAVKIATRPGGPSVAERAQALPRLVRATSHGSYRGSNVGRLALMGAAALYLVSPLDLVPEALVPVLGFADDAFVASWLVKQFVEETESFLSWENGGSAGGAGDPGPGAYGASSPSSQTVPGDVVR